MLNSKYSNTKGVKKDEDGRLLCADRQLHHTAFVSEIAYYSDRSVCALYQDATDRKEACFCCEEQKCLILFLDFRSKSWTSFFSRNFYSLDFFYFKNLTLHLVNGSFFLDFFQFTS